MRRKRGYYDNFVRTCAKFSSKIAIRNYENGIFKTYTYSELYGICEYISQNLQQLQCCNAIVGLLTERNLMIPSVVAAVHKCYKTFMFLDPNSNNSLILNEIKFGIIITIGHFKNTTHFLNKAPDKQIEIFGLVVAFYKINNHPYIDQNRYGNEYSFIALTSGSTGEPKQIQIPIQCIQPNVDDLTKLFQITSEDVIYFSTPLTFDPSMIEILLACMNAASLLIAPEEINLLFLGQNNCSLTFWQTTPSKFFQFSEEDISTKILCANSTLKVLALGGEPLNNVEHLRELRAKENKTKIYTMYGVTEMSCWACVAELDLQKIQNEIPLGVCLSETRLRLQFNDQNKDIGKIMLGSQSRWCTVLNKPVHEDKNAIKWIDTGDLGEYKNGSVYYRGRRDDIIKRFGNKVNLQLIERTVMQCPQIKLCSCIWLPTPMILVLYFTSSSFSSNDLANYLKSELDEKHWPDHVIRIDNIPMNKHGKISKVVLSNLFENSRTKPADLKNVQTIFLTELQYTLNNKFDYDQIKDKDFFSLGGTSFLAMALTNRLSMIHTLFRQILPSLLSYKSLEHVITNLKTHVETEYYSKLTAVPNKCKRIKSPAENNDKDCKRPMTCKNLISLRVRWSYDTGKCVDASPSLYKSSDTTLVTVGSHSGKIVVLNAVDGTPRGNIQLKARIEATVFCYKNMQLHGQGCGVVGAYDGTVICFVLESCQEIWRINIRSMIKSKATSYNKQLFIASYDGAVRYINLLTGAIKHTIKISDQAISADLVLAKNEYLLVATLSGTCACIHIASRSVLWQEKFGNPVFANPVLYDDNKFVVFTEVSGEIHCRSVEKGVKIWDYEGVEGNVFSSMYVKTVGPTMWQMTFGCHDKHVYCINVCIAQAKLHWKTTMSSPVYSTPCAINEDYIISATSNGHVYVIDSETGSIVYEYKLPNDIFSSPIVHDDYIFVGCRDDHLYALKFLAEN